MAKGLPYFKFTVSEWLTGDIIFESLEAQGLFINICALYWNRDGKLKVDEVLKRYNKSELIANLSERFISVSDGYISIAFLDEQFSERNGLSKTNSKNGKLGGRPKALINIDNKTERLSNANRNESETKANESNIEKKREEKNLVIQGKVVYWNVFHEYAKSLKEYYKPELDYSIETVYTEWAELDGKLSSGREIKEWKKTLRNTIPHLKPMKKPIEIPLEETDREYKIRMLRERGFAV